MENKMSPVVHFEMPFVDRNRVAEFYRNAFGWHMQMLGPEMGNYVLAGTTELDEQTQFPKEPGRINGGFFERTPDNQYPSIVISVDDIRESMRRVEAAGGRIVGAQKPGEPDDIPGIGLYVSFVDSEGNRAGMLQPHPM
jgi:predicted enzyme related to lactoylglutathione lyase